MTTSVKVIFTAAVFLFGAIGQAQAPGAGPPNILIPAGKVTSDAISSDGTDPATWPASLDAPVAAPTNHKILYEDDDVRVLLVTVRPDEREKVHYHRWPSVLVVLGERHVEDFDATGNRLPAPPPLPENFKWPVVLRWPPGAAHSIHNLDRAKPFHAIRVEFKHGFPTPQK